VRIELKTAVNVKTDAFGLIPQNCGMEERKVQAMADNSMKNRIQSFGDQVAETATSTAEKASSVAEDVSNRAKDLASQAYRQAESAGAYIADRAEDATTAVGERLKAAGDASSTMGQNVGQRLKETGDYIGQRGAEGLMDDFSSVIRQNPVASVMVGVAAGFLLSTMFRRD